jgi:glucose/arabinose dehydrogenase
VQRLSLTAIIFISTWHIISCGGGENGTGNSSSPSVWPEISLSRVLSGFSEPLGITHSGDGSGRIFIVERGGKIFVVKGSVSLPIPFLDISNRVTTTGSEQGLLGLAFPPDYATKGYFYLNYTRSPDGHTLVARYLITGDPDRADPESEVVLLTIPQPFANHNGGQMQFGPDGFFYIGTGDGGSGGDPQNRAQDTGSLLGKLLRIDVESGTKPYGIPPGNPFRADPDKLDEIWALGLRNPWRFSFDRQTGDLYIADVGQGSFEEVDVQDAQSTGGENYGWNIMEGSRCFGSVSCNQAGLTRPVVEYDHSDGNCSVTGGMVYRGQEFLEMVGIYFYGDFCSGRIWGLRKEGSFWENILLLDSAFLISTFGEDEAGRLYVADYRGGEIYEIVLQE